jgi:hypothetical protein
MENSEKIPELKIHIENPAGTYKSFQTEDDPVWEKYPLKGVTYPVDYGYIEGYQGEDEAELDVFIGSGDLNGYIKVSRMDVPEETKFFKNLTQEELDKVIETFKPVLINYQIIGYKDLFIREIEKFKINK